MEKGREEAPFAAILPGRRTDECVRGNGKADSSLRRRIRSGSGRNDRALFAPEPGPCFAPRTRALFAQTRVFVLHPNQGYPSFCSRPNLGCPFPFLSAFADVVARDGGSSLRLKPVEHRRLLGAAWAWRRWRLEIARCRSIARLRHTSRGRTDEAALQARRRNYWWRQEPHVLAFVPGIERIPR